MGPTLLLFDIDGTILLTKGVGIRALAAAAERLFGKPFDITAINTAGNLDPLIYVELAAQHAIDNPLQHHEAFRDLYLKELAVGLKGANSVYALPGIHGLLNQLKNHRGALLGLLSGNYRAAIPIKFGPIGINPDWFTITALGDEAPTRPDLVALAMDRYKKPLGVAPAPNRVVVIGDTPRDVSCAHAHNCVAFGVATGRFSSDDLEKAGAEFVVEDLSDPTPLLNLLV